MRFIRSIVAALALLILMPIPATAHESRNVGELEAVVGWDSEPAVAGFLNAVSVRIGHKEGTHDEAVSGAKLTVQVSFGDTTGESLPLEPAFGDPGHYKATVIPTRPGVYIFHVTGRAHGARFDQRFTSGDKTFDSPAPAEDLEFPEQDPSRSQLAERITAIDGRVTQAAAKTDDAGSKASLGTILGAAGLGVGVVALLVALLRKPKSDPAS